MEEIDSQAGALWALSEACALVKGVGWLAARTVGAIFTRWILQGLRAAEHGHMPGRGGRGDTGTISTCSHDPRGRVRGNRSTSILPGR